MGTCKWCHETIWRTTEYVNGERVKIWVDNLGTNFCPAPESDRLDHEPLEDDLAVAA